MSTQRIDDSNACLHRAGFIDPFFIREVSLAPGEVHQGEAHHVDHVTNILEGPVRIEWRDPNTGEEGVYEITVPCKVRIPAPRWHRFVAYDKPVRWECWFPSDPDV